MLRPAKTSSDSLELSVERADGRDSAPQSRWRIPAHYAPTLALDRVSGTRHVVGNDVRANAVVTSVGRIGSDTVKTTHLSAGVAAGRPLHTYRDGTSLIATFHGSYGARQMLLTMLGVYPFRWDVWHVVKGERRGIGLLPGMPECGGPDDALLCVARGRSGVTLWRLDGRGPSAASSLGMLPAGLNVWDIGTDGRLAAASHDGGTLAIVDAGLGRATRIILGGDVRLQGAPQGSGSYSHAADVAIGPDVMAVLVVREQKSEVMLYRVR